MAHVGDESYVNNECGKLLESIMISQKGWMTTTDFELPTWKDISANTKIPFERIQQLIAQMSVKDFNIREIPQDQAEVLGRPLQNPYGAPGPREQTGTEWSYFKHEIEAFAVSIHLIYHGDVTGITTRKQLVEYVRKFFREISELRDWDEFDPTVMPLIHKSDEMVEGLIERCFPPEYNKNQLLVDIRKNREGLDVHGVVPDCKTN